MDTVQSTRLDFRPREPYSLQHVTVVVRTQRNLMGSSPSDGSLCCSHHHDFLGFFFWFVVVVCWFLVLLLLLLFFKFCLLIFLFVCFVL